jgi:hypothetical protein
LIILRAVFIIIAFLRGFQDSSLSVIRRSFVEILLILVLLKHRRLTQAMWLFIKKISVLTAASVV